MNKIKLTVGDWSHDGHEKTDDIFILSNLTGKEIEKAYKKATKKLGFNLTEQVASEYEDDRISLEKLQILRDNGFEDKLFDEDYIDKQLNDEVRLDVDEFVAIYLFIIKLGNPDFEYKFDEEDEGIHIGGYGLYQ